MNGLIEDLNINTLSGINTINADIVNGSTGIFSSLSVNGINITSGGGGGGSVGPTGPYGPVGPTGATGSTGDTGQAGIIFRWLSTYSAGTTYLIYDCVLFSGSSYICILSCVGVAPTNNTYWCLVASQGDVGPRGLPGAQGSSGADGADGADGATGPAGANGSAGADGAAMTVAGLAALLGITDLIATAGLAVIISGMQDEIFALANKTFYMGATLPGIATTTFAGQINCDYLNTGTLFATGGITSESTITCNGLTINGGGLTLTNMTIENTMTATNIVADKIDAKTATSGTLQIGTSGTNANITIGKSDSVMTLAGYDITLGNNTPFDKPTIQIKGDGISNNAVSYISNFTDGYIAQQASDYVVSASNIVFNSQHIVIGDIFSSVSIPSLNLNYSASGFFDQFYSG